MFTGKVLIMALLEEPVIILMSLFDIPDEFDLYGGVSAGYYVYRWKYTRNYNYVYDPGGGYINLGDAYWRHLFYKRKFWAKR